MNNVRPDLIPRIIREARLDDLESIREIYNQAIETSTASFYLEPRSYEQQEYWFQQRGPRHPVLVTEINGLVVAWSSLSPWAERPAYRDTAETTLYVRDGFRNQGIGRRLKQALIDRARREGFHTLIAQVAEGSDASLHLNQSMGFQLVGILREVGHKFGRHLDVHILQLMLKT